MNEDERIRLFFSGLEKLGPGDNEHTRDALHLLPARPAEVIVDAGCGTGRQTIALAKELGGPIHAVDIYPFFLDELLDRARKAGVAHQIQVHCMNMQDIPDVFPRIGLLWSEGAAYNIGFPHALKTWASAVVPSGFAVVSELCWLKEKVSAEVREFFASAYPGMQTVEQNRLAVKEAGYQLYATRPIPHQAWVDGYYLPLASRAQRFLHHSDPTVRDYAKEILREIGIFNISQDSFGYVFFVLQRC
jgi:cyclopropane fatty-acyl-phospholipid synthase-like methyltransferase